VLVLWWTGTMLVPALLCMRSGQRGAARAFALVWLLGGALLATTWIFGQRDEDDLPPPAGAPLNRSDHVRDS
jgi:hypothetical protein